MEYEAVIGLEVHVQAKTKSKIFCGCSTEFGNSPNENTCPVCTAQPGVLPVLNKKVVELAIKAGVALNCKINEKSIFARKNYFYPDLPKAYQISQFDQPICGKGFVEVALSDGKKKKLGITRVHMEEDAGKLVHQGADGIEGAHSSFVDLNRAGVPLLEIVSEPDMRTAEEAKAYLEKVKTILQYAGVSDANMEEGKLRCDANVSIRPVGQKEFGVKTEVKNMNSFKGVERAIKAEIKRQIAVLKKGGKIVQETRNFVDATGETTALRSKEESHDYRYFPEPDLVPLLVDQKWVDEVKKTLPEMPEQRKEKYVKEYGIPEYDAEVLTTDKEMAEYFEQTVKKYDDAKTISNWLMGDVTALLKEKQTSINKSKLTVDLFVEMLNLIKDGIISGKIAKDVLPKIIETGKSPKEIVEASGMKQISDEGEIKKIIEDVIAKNQKQVEQYKSGKTAVFGFFVGQVMKETKGKAKPELVNKLLKELLG
ncbi:MAG: Asp-tRNA(Asn)/Glu-tRNA(Gln) amidotransferase subunit GatB [Candidatus Margulisbacteria bacterium]|nr:Asp-tRNA(Asn)/Glu-tRNA(Gln) amidotransferase subunit GatB [Candidatus Margulisiibacteriota bacterium]